MSFVSQPSLLASTQPLQLAEMGTAVQRRTLTEGAWVDLRPGFVTGADELFDALARQVPWTGEQMRLYDKTVSLPRMTARYRREDPLPHPVLEEARDALNRHYLSELREPFVSAGLCLYRDGRDGVAWHGDRVARDSLGDTMVAIVSLGATRALALKPRSGGPALRLALGHGDLLVMGGSCQRTWLHAVPKTTKALGARISIQFRPDWGNGLGGSHSEPPA